MSVSSATTRLPARVPTRTRARARFRAAAASFMNAPASDFDVEHQPVDPLRELLGQNAGHDERTHSTVPVTSRSA